MKPVSYTHLKALNKVIIENEEYINLGKTIEETEGAITIGQYAKIISNKTNMGRNRLYKWFRAVSYTHLDVYKRQTLYTYNQRIYEKFFYVRYKRQLSFNITINGKNYRRLSKGL